VKLNPGPAHILATHPPKPAEGKAPSLWVHPQKQKQGRGTRPLAFVQNGRRFKEPNLSFQNSD
jgi:hypothetical protein